MTTQVEARASGLGITRDDAERAGTGGRVRHGETQREGEVQREVAQRGRDVAAQLRGYGDARVSRGREVRAGLAREIVALHQAEAQRDGEAQREMAQRRQDIAQRGREVTTWLRGYSDEQVRMQRTAATMQVGRAGAVAVATPASTLEEEQEAVERAQVGEVTEELSTLSERVFEYLANHHLDGARLTAIEEEFGLSRFESARVVRNLINDGKAEKRDLLYFVV
mgnify:CR=1 FL=1